MTSFFLTIFSAIIIGISKSGVPNIGILAVIGMLQFFSLKFSAAVLLPLLVTADLMALKNYRHKLKVDALDRVVSFILIGVVIGIFVFAYVDLDNWLRPFLGGGLFLAVLLRFAIIQKWISFKKEGSFIQAILATIGGVMTLSSHAGGPFISLCLLYENASKESFLARYALLFFIINTIKVPVYYFSSALSQETLFLSLIGVPFVLIGASIGKKLQQKMSPRFFERMTLLILFFVSLGLLI